MAEDTKKPRKGRKPSPTNPLRLRGGSAFTSRLVECMERSGMSCADLARKIGLPEATLGYRLREGGDNSWSPTDVVPLAMILRVDPAFLLCQTHDPRGPGQVRNYFTEAAETVEGLEADLGRVALQLRRLATGSADVDATAAGPATG